MSTHVQDALFNTVDVMRASARMAVMLERRRNGVDIPLSSGQHANQNLESKYPL